MSAALAGRRVGLYISEQTRQRVVETARQLGYPLHRRRTPRPQAQRVLLFCGSAVVYESAVLELCDLLSKHGFQTLVDMRHQRSQAAAAAVEAIRRHQAEAAILIGTRSHPEEVAVGDAPCVFVGDVPDGCSVWRVTMDNEGGGRAVGEHLWSLGHRRVGMIALEGAMAAQKRWKGLRSVWQMHACPLPDNGVLALGSDLNEGQFRDALLGFLETRRRLGEPLTALFCWHDQTAMLVLHILTEAGIRVPQDMSLVGFDDLEYAQYLQPPLTTVRQAFSQVAALAMQLLLERLQDPSQPPKVYTLGYQLMVRGSTAPVPGHRER